MDVKFNKDILRSELKITDTPCGDILDVFSVYSMTENWFEFKMAVYEKALCVILTDNSTKVYYHIDALRNDEFGFYEAMLDVLENTIITNSRHSSIAVETVERDSILELKAISLLSFETYDMDYLIESLLISVRGE